LSTKQSFHSEDSKERSEEKLYVKTLVTTMVDSQKNQLNTLFLFLRTERCQITHVATQRAVSGRRRTYRAHGRISPYLSSNTHMEFHVTEKSAPVKREDKQKVRLTKK